MVNVNTLIQQSNLLEEEKTYLQQFVMQNPTGTLVTRKKNEWVNADYQKSNIHPEGLRYPTILPDLKVRSKAESQIVELLSRLGIPFRYEELLVVNGIALHPDFSCLNAKTRQVIYIEHQGMWDQQRYVSKLRSREELLCEAGIYPWINLLITTETYDHPLDINWMEVMLRYYLL